MRTTNLIILGSVWDMLPKLNDKQVACLFRGLADWRLGNDPVFKDPLVQGIWLGLEPNLNQSVKKYKQQVEKNRENGAKGGRPKKTEPNPNNPSGFLETQLNPQKHKDKDKDRDKDMDKDMDKDKNKEIDINKELDRILELKNIL
jgi:hypothetical protein